MYFCPDEMISVTGAVSAALQSEEDIFIFIFSPLFNEQGLLF